MLVLRYAFCAVSVLLAVLVLARRSSGAGLAEMFGGGLSAQVSSSSRAGRNLTLAAALTGAVWVALAVTIAALTP